MTLQSRRNITAVSRKARAPRLDTMATAAEDAGFAPRSGDTLAAAGDSGTPTSATVKDLTGRSVLPGMPGVPGMPGLPDTTVRPSAPADGVQPDTHARLAQTFGAVVANVRSAYVGRDSTVRLALCCLMAEGHLLVEDHPGVGKTTLAKALARSLGLDVRPSAVHRRPAPLRCHWCHGLRPRQRTHRLSTGARLHQHPAGGRAQPGVTQGPVRTPGVHGGAPGQRGRHQPPPAATVHGDRHPEPLRLGGDVPAPPQPT